MSKAAPKVPLSDDERDRSHEILADVQRATDHARAVALDTLAMLAGMRDDGVTHHEG